jgi:hypothetical protein
VDPCGRKVKCGRGPTVKIVQKLRNDLQSPRRGEAQDAQHGTDANGIGFAMGRMVRRPSSNRTTFRRKTS